MRSLTQFFLVLLLLASVCAQKAHAENSSVLCPPSARDHIQFATVEWVNDQGLHIDTPAIPNHIESMNKEAYHPIFANVQPINISSHGGAFQQLDMAASNVVVPVIRLVSSGVTDFVSPASCYF